MTGAKDVWTPAELGELANLLEAVSDFFQDRTGNGQGFRLRELMFTLEDEHPYGIGRDSTRQNWGIVCLTDADEVTFQYEQGDYELGLV